MPLSLGEGLPGCIPQAIVLLRSYVRLREAVRLHARRDPDWQRFARALSNPSVADLLVREAVLRRRGQASRRGHEWGNIRKIYDEVGPTLPQIDFSSENLLEHGSTQVFLRESFRASALCVAWSRLALSCRPCRQPIPHPCLR